MEKSLGVEIAGPLRPFHEFLKPLEGGSGIIKLAQPELGHGERGEVGGRGRT